jgi:ribonuclease HI
VTQRLYCDGGVLKVNPSPYGGTWAWCLTNDEPKYANDGDSGENITRCASGFISPEWGVNGFVSNNVSELWAAVSALEVMPFDWKGTLCSDSQVTLGRLAREWPLRGVPDYLAHWLADIRLRLRTDLLGVEFLLLQGHPTKADLASGIGARHGYPVSKFNVWCDQACTERAKEVT